MRIRAFASRNLKEIIRDPLTLFFGIGFPVVLLLLLTAIQSNIPDSVSLFKIESLTPGIAVFGLSFISLFSGLLIAKDRSTSFLIRLFASPLTATDCIVGYTLPLIPMSIAQSIVTFIVAAFLGLSINIHLLMTLVVLIPAALLYIAIGLLAGSLLNDKQVGGICGALLTNLSAWLSGTWFDLKLVGGVFEKIANILPFSHAVEATRAAIIGDYSGILKHLWWVIGYAILLFVIAVFVFNKKMSSDKA